MSTVRILFLGTPEFAVPSLDALIEDEHFEVVGVVTQPDRPAGRKRKLTPSPVKVFALERGGLPIYTPEKIKDPEVLDELKKARADAAVVVAFGQLLPQAFLDMFPYGAVNIHSSVLPRWRGAAPIQRAIMAGDSETGVSLQKIVLKLDAGDVLASQRVEITENMDAIELHDILKEKARSLLTVDFMDYLRGNLAGTSQDESLVTYAKKIDSNEGLVDWAKPAREIHNQVRGLALGPKTWSFRGGQKLKVLKTQLTDGQGRPGSVIEVGKQSFTVACGRGALKVLRVQPDSKQAMDVSQYLVGKPMKPGEALG